ncbi:MAG: hypothetical protein JWR80_4598 [Bradyrhizobium sp.]|jgi:hypothetical protein|nr:hypothetical protein [Bradyrhizobium sp.]
MAKKKSVAAQDLVFLFEMHLRGKTSTKVPAPNVAIVPDPIYNWMAVTAAKDRRRHPDLAKRIDKLQTKLRALYQLQSD